MKETVRHGSLLKIYQYQ